MARMKNDLMRHSLTDLHAHILPNVDDGAESLESAVEMLRVLKANGVDRVALTPHFYPMREDLPKFLARREKAYQMLLAVWDDQTMPQMQLGAEVRYTPKLVELDLRKLTIGGGGYLLLELPDVGLSSLAEQVIAVMLQQGITPVLAHVERCQSFRKDPSLLFRLIQEGAVAQISIEALVEKTDRFSVACLQNGLAQIISTDIHNLKDRFYFYDRTAVKKYGELICWTEAFARSVWDNKPLPSFSIRPIKKGLFGYR